MNEERAARTFDRLRHRPAPAKSPEQKVLTAAIRKVVSTDEGKVLLAHMRFVAGQVPAPDASDGALRELNGVRRFIANIEAMIADVGEGNH